MRLGGGAGRGGVLGAGGGGRPNFSIFIYIMTNLDNETRRQPVPWETNILPSFLHFHPTLECSTNDEKSCFSYEKNL